MRLYFSDFFDVDVATVDKYGAFNISLLADLPLFVDPFLIFNSNKTSYKTLHQDIVTYLVFLRDKAAQTGSTSPLIGAWYRFPEIKANWLGFSATGNDGRGLGQKFALALHANLHSIITGFGDETITKGTHLEKLCLISDGVGRDSISDFTNNLIHEYLLRYTETFAKKHIDPKFRRIITVPRVRFNYETETWVSTAFDLPIHQGRHVLLTPIDLLTKDDTWINKHDLVVDFDHIPQSIPNAQLRAQINNYFRKLLPKKPRAKDKSEAVRRTLLKFPDLIDYYIKYKEDHGDKAEALSAEKVRLSQQLYVQQFAALVNQLEKTSQFYAIDGSTYEEALRRVHFLKDVIEQNGGYKVFYVKGNPIEREDDLQILYRLTWYNTAADVSREVNDGRGPVDFKVSNGAKDKSLVEMKLASNSRLKQNLAKQAEVYKKASNAQHTIKVILCFSAAEQRRVESVLKELKLTGHPGVVLIDARRDNKPSGSRA